MLGGTHQLYFSVTLPVLNLSASILISLWALDRSVSLGLLSPSGSGAEPDVPVLLLSRRDVGMFQLPIIEKVLD